MRKLFFVLVAGILCLNTSMAQMGVLTVQSPSPVPNPMVDGVTYDFVLHYDNTSLLGVEWIFQTSTLTLLSGSATFSGLIIAGNQVSFSVTPNSGIESLSWTFSASDGTSDGWGTYTYSEAVVPITLHSFKGEKNRNELIVSWQTESEVNNDFFMLQRSVDGMDFETIDNINSISSNNEGASYVYVDREAIDLDSEMVYYRLQQVDLDGKYSLSDRIAIRLRNHLDQVFRIDYANKTSSSELLIQLSSKADNQAQIMVCSLNGAAVKEQSFDVSEGKNMLRFNFGSALTKGMYVITVRSNHTIQTKKIFL